MWFPLDFVKSGKIVPRQTSECEQDMEVEKFQNLVLSLNRASREVEKFRRKHLLY